MFQVPSELPRVSQEDDAQTVDVEQLHLGPTDVVVLGRYPKSKQQALLRRLQAVGSSNYTPFAIRHYAVSGRQLAESQLGYTNTCGLSTCRRGYLASRRTG